MGLLSSWKDVQSCHTTNSMLYFWQCKVYKNRWRSSRIQSTVCCQKAMETFSAGYSLRLSWTIYRYIFTFTTLDTKNFSFIFDLWSSLTSPSVLHLYIHSFDLQWLFSGSYDNRQHPLIQYNLQIIQRRFVISQLNNSWLFRNATQST